MTGFHYTVEVPWADTDAAQVVWFGNFCRYVEAAEVALFTALGHPLPGILAAHHILVPRTHFTCSFRSTARFADVLRVTLGVASVSDRRVAFAFEITREDTGRVVAQGAYRIACVDASTFQAMAFPAELLAILTNGVAALSGRP
jgi:YbgC/YbaW family acyl-CoA thioester hydrolase